MLEKLRSFARAHKVISVIAILILIGMVGSILDGTADDTLVATEQVFSGEVAERTPVATADAPEQPTPSPEKKDSLGIGEEGYLRVDSEDKGEIVLLATTEDAYSEVMKSLQAKDMLGIVGNPNAFGVGNGTKVLVIDSAIGRRKVRIVETYRDVDADKSGLAGWVAMEFVTSEPLYPTE